MWFRHEINPLRGEGGEEQLEFALEKCKVSIIQEKHTSEMKGSADPAFVQEFFSGLLSSSTTQEWSFLASGEPRHSEL